MEKNTVAKILNICTVIVLGFVGAVAFWSLTQIAYYLGFLIGGM